MPTSVISHTTTTPSGASIGAGFEVEALLMPTAGFRTSDSSGVARRAETTTDSNGAFTLTLERNSNIDPPDDSFWMVYIHLSEDLGGTQTWPISVGASNSTLLAALIEPSSNAGLALYLTQAAADARYQAIGAGSADLGIINVLDYGALGDGVTNDTAAIQAAINAGDNNIVFFPDGTYLTTGNTFVGRSCSLRGVGDRSIIKGYSGITGPVLDFTSYSYPSNNVAPREVLSHLRVQGDGTAGTAKKGVHMPNLASILVRDIGISGTGGPCLDISGTQLSDFYEVILNTPVSAKANDVPYLYAEGATNGNRFYGLGLRSISASADVGGSGAVVMVEDASYAPHFNHFFAPWVEFLHVPTNGTIFHLQGGAVIIDSYQPFDTGKEAAATGTSHFRFEPVSGGISGLSGANEVRGLIPGSQGGTDMDCGIRDYQGRNFFHGFKGYQGTNVILESGCVFTIVDLAGETSSSTNAAVTDNSGATTNLVIDRSQGTVSVVSGPTRLPAGITAYAPLRIPHGSAPTSPVNGDMWTTTAGLFVRINGATVGPLS